MNKKIIFLTALLIPFIQHAYAQRQNDIILSNEELILIFSISIAAVIAIFLYIARDMILRKKTDYDKGEFESQKNRDYEKYHSEWSDDSVDFESSKKFETDEEFENSLHRDNLPNYYQVLGISNDASQEEIKKQYRFLAKENHPDRAKDKDVSEKIMIEINEAYEVLSDQDRRRRYDMYFKGPA